MKRIKLLLVVAFAVILLAPTQIKAQTDGDTGSGISISPTRFEFVIERGATQTAAIQIKNVTEQDFVARAFLNDFEPDGVTGNPKLLIDDNLESSNSLRGFIGELEDVPVAAGQTVQVDIPITVPENSAPGAYYGAVRYVAASAIEGEDADRQLSLNASVAAIMLVEVPGDIVERIEISDVSAYLNDKSGSIFTKSPTEAGITIKNLGNGFAKPFGSVIVDGPWGAGQVFSYELNNTTPRGNVLPESSRLFKNPIENISKPGRYTITANVSYGRGGEIIVSKSSFWYLPLWFIILVAIITLLIVATAAFLVRKYKTKKTKRSK
jgi:hypothetical protein